MAGYIGIGGKASRLKGIYWGVSNKARKIKKGYIGVNGVARQFYSSGISKATYVGRLADLDKSWYDLKAAPVGEDYLLFAGGTIGDDITANAIAYDEEFVRQNIQGLSGSTRYHGAASVEGYALFACGQGSASNFRGYTNAYDAALVRTIPTSLTNAGERHNLCGCSVDNGSLSHCLFAGGSTESSSSSDVVDGYDANLVKVKAANLTTTTYDLGSAVVGQYIIFAMGDSGNYAQIYDGNTLEKNETSINIPYERSRRTGISFGKYAMFTNSLREVYTIDENLVRNQIDVSGGQSGGVVYGGVGHPDGYALFAGSKGSAYGLNQDLVIERFTIESDKDNVAVGRVGNIVILAGGNSSGSATASKRVNGFKLS